LRTITLFLGWTILRLHRQELQLLALINRQPPANREATGKALITPEATGPKAIVGTRNPRLNSAGSDILDWDVVSSGSVVLPPR